MISALGFLLLFFPGIVLPLGNAAQTQPPIANSPALTAAEQLYRSGKFAEAAEKYQEVLKQDPQAIPAQVGLVRSWLRQQKVDEAYAEARRDLELHPDSAALLAALGDVQFRRAEMWDAETTYRKALTLDPNQVQAHLGIAKLAESYSFYRRAYDHLQLAHRLAPDDPEVQARWFDEMPRKERLAAIEAYLAGPHPDDPQETKDWQHYVEFLKATVYKPPHTCELISGTESSEIKLFAMLRTQKHRLSGYGMTVNVNDRAERLLLDTGASGILISRRAAQKAGLKSISKIAISGFGEDKTEHTGDVAVADRIRVGELEFHDCLVRVTDRAVTEEDGLIGADVFDSFLVDINFPREKLKLSPLPKRPDETNAAPKSLNSPGEAQALSGVEKEKQPTAGAQNPTPSEGNPLLSANRLPHDPYVAPEMKNWTSVFRFGHLLLIPSRLDNSQPMLFLLDTGAECNMLSQKAAKLVGKTYIDPDLEIVGLSGTIKNVYRAQTATLHFGHFAQTNEYMVTVDLTKEAREMGTELSGVIGFDLLRMLEVKIDYRDGIVDFVYDAKR